MILQIGQILYGYCGGFFDGWSTYDDIRRIEAVGVDWVVARQENNEPVFASGARAIAYLQTDECTTKLAEER